MVQLAHSCALLQMPRMPELAHRPDLAAFQPSTVDHIAAIQVLPMACMMPAHHQQLALARFASLGMASATAWGLSCGALSSSSTRARSTMSHYCPPMAYLHAAEQGWSFIMVASAHSSKACD